MDFLQNLQYAGYPDSPGIMPNALLIILYLPNSYFIVRLARLTLTTAWVLTIFKLIIIILSDDFFHFTANLQSVHFRCHRVDLELT